MIKFQSCVYCLWLTHIFFPWCYSFLFPSLPLLLCLAMVFSIYSLELLIPVDYVPLSPHLRRGRKPRGVWSGRNALSLAENKLTKIFLQSRSLLWTRFWVYFTVSTLLLLQWGDLSRIFILKTSGVSESKPHRNLRDPMEIFTLMLIQTQILAIHQNYHSNISTILSLHWLLLQVWFSVCACFSWFGGCKFP